MRSPYYVRKSTREKFKPLKTHCRYCGVYEKELHIEHIIPRSIKVCSEEHNLTIACKRCNSSKGVFTIHEWFLNINKKREINFTKTKKYINDLREHIPNKYDRNKVKYGIWVTDKVRKGAIEHKRLTSIINSLINKKYILQHDNN